MEREARHGSMALMDTRLAHETHRVSTALLAEAAGRPSVPVAALARLRDFVVANLRHHHETEDELLWPLIASAAPAAASELAALSEEHERLDAALGLLAAVVVDEVVDVVVDEAVDEVVDGASGPADELADRRARIALRDAAVAVGDAVREHLAHEEPVLFPVLREHITPAQWDDFSRQVIAGTPPVAGHLMIGFLDEVGTPAEVELMLGNLPEPVRELLPVLRQQAADDLRVLRGNAA